jgi:hypothetical protein
MRTIIAVIGRRLPRSSLDRAVNQGPRLEVRNPPRRRRLDSRMTAREPNF